MADRIGPVAPTRRAVLGAAAAMATTRSAFAQAFPERSIRAICPLPAGSPIDVVGRVITPALSQTLGRAVILDNRPGAGGTLGTRAVAIAEPDGYTLLFNDAVSHVLAPSFSASLSYDPLKDFIPIGAVGRSDWIMAVDPGTPANTVAELTAYAKAHPGQLNFGFGLATAPQVIGELYKQATGAEIVNVPFKSGTEAVNEMLGGRINLDFGTLAVLKPLILDGKLRPLAVTSERRSPDLPDTPTMKEAGLPALTLAFSVGFFAPKGTPSPVVDRLHDALVEAVSTDVVRQALLRIGFEAQTPSRAAFARTLDDYSATWSPVARGLGVKID